MAKFLYRGINITMHEKNEGLKHKGVNFIREPQHGEDYAQHGSNIQLGESKMNSILAST